MKAGKPIIKIDSSGVGIPFFTNYGTEQGLPINNIICSATDKAGNLWFGTGGGGVSKYDGKSFTNYTMDQGLAGNIVFWIIEDKGANLWFGTTSGASKYDGYRFTNYTTAQGLADNFVTCIMQERISRDLHDDVGTKLSALKLFISALYEKATETNNEEIKALAISSEQFITEAVQDVRQLLQNLSPSVLEEFGYTSAIEGLVNKINETKKLHFNLVIFGMKQRLRKEYELALYRITQELINNVLKHAEAKHVSLQIGRRDQKIILMIEDDGKGFDITTYKDGYGLHNLEARTKLLNGIMTIDSHPGKGTSVLIETPYNFNQE